MISNSRIEITAIALSLFSRWSNTQEYTKATAINATKLVVNIITLKRNIKSMPQK